jgi:hypothetical protein
VVHGVGEGPHVEGMVNAIMRISHNESIARKIVFFVSTFIFPRRWFLLSFLSHRAGVGGSGGGRSDQL